jgi:hypothetical protein
LSRARAVSHRRFPYRKVGRGGGSRSSSSIERRTRARMSAGRLWVAIILSRSSAADGETRTRATTDR